MSKKDSYWFRHDSTAGRALKMRKMAHVYGHWGKGVYWDVVEILRDQENYQFENDESSLQMLADLIGCKDDNKFISWFNDCIKFGLLKLEKEHFISPALSEVMIRWQSSKANGNKGGRPKKEVEETQTKPNHKPKQNLTSNLNETIIEYNSIEEEIIEEDKKEYFNYWLGYRKSIKKEVKNKTTLNSLIKRFNSEQLDKVKWVVNNSVENSYQGLFWDNYKGQKTKTVKPTDNLAF